MVLLELNGLARQQKQLKPLFVLGIHLLALSPLGFARLLSWLHIIHFHIQIQLMQEFCILYTSLYYTIVDFMLFFNTQKMFTKQHHCKSALLVGCGCVG